MLLKTLKQSGLKILIFTVLFTLSLMLYGAVTINPVPNTFVSKTALKASEMNANFTALYNNDMALKTAVDSMWSLNASNLYYSSGNVGIGTSSPTSLLHLNSGTASTHITIMSPSNWESGISFFNNSSQGYQLYRPVNTTDLSFWNSASDTLYLKSNGNVGIGNNNPQQKMHINGYMRTTRDAHNWDIGSTASGALFLDYNGVNNFLINANGNVGIGTANPGGKLQVYNTNTSIDRAADIWNNHSTAGTKYGLVASSTGSSTTNIGIYVDATDATNNYAAIFNTGKVGIGIANPTYILQVNGQPAANGYTAFTNYSDFRLKRDIKELDAMLIKVMALNPVSFYYNSKSGYSELNRQFTGFTAQELKQIFPDMVGEIKINGEAYFDSNLSALPVILVKALQELKTEKDLQIETQQAQIETLKAENTELKSRLEAIEKKLGIR